MNDQLRNQRGADAYNAVCLLDRRRNNEPRPPETKEMMALCLLGIAIVFAATCWLCTDSGIVFLAKLWEVV